MKCKHSTCNVKPIFGKKGGTGRKNAEYCKKHAPKDYVDVVSKQCQHPMCNVRPIFGKKGGTGTNAEYCKEHAPEDYVDVVNKQCQHSMCNVKPIFGKKGGTRTNAEYCKKHAPKDYVDVVNKQCQHSMCNARPRYGNLGHPAQYCAKHKKAGMITNPRKRCSDSKCKKWSSHVKDELFYCSDHRPENADEIGNICCICYAVYADGICDGCKTAIDLGKTVKRKNKELTIKNLLHSNGIPIESHDKMIGASRKRPDFVISSPYGNIILEVDEFQHNHKTYPCQCEITRMRQLFFDLNSEKPGIFIRYNPDSYKPSFGKQYSQSKRHDLLIKWVQHYMNNPPEHQCAVVYLFYDGFTEDISVEMLDPYKE